MKIKPDVDLQTLAEDCGFLAFDAEDYGSSFEECEPQYLLNIGEGRRGQRYYLFIMPDRALKLYASKPDGSGSPTDFTSMLMDVIEYLTTNNLLTNHG